MGDWWGSKNMPAAQARCSRGRKTEILATFDGWAPEIIDVIERTPDQTIVTVPAQDRPFLEKWGCGPVSLLGDAAHPMQTSLGKARAPRLKTPTCWRRRFLECSILLRRSGDTRIFVATALGCWYGVRGGTAGWSRCRTPAVRAAPAGSGRAMHADMGPQAAQHPSDAVRPGVGSEMSQEVAPMEGLARLVSRYAGLILAVVVVLVALSGLYSGYLSSRLSGGGWTVPGSEEARAERAQEAGFVGRGSSSVVLVVHDDRFSAPSPEFGQRVEGVIQQITADPRLQIRSQSGWSSQPAPQRDGFLGRDGRTTLTTFELGIDDGTAKRVLPEVERGLSRFDAAGLRVYPVGAICRIRRDQ